MCISMKKRRDRGEVDDGWWMMIFGGGFCKHVSGTM